ncbi:MAG: CDP-alcohol phosphatidyltransferase family protein [Anaerolineae bacterium]
MTRRKAAAWLVQLYTTTGGIVGLFALLEASRNNIRQSFLLLIVTGLIDGTDGILARRVKVKEVLPNFDGAMIDNIIDVLTYVWIPIFIIGTQNLLPHPLWLAVPVLAAMYAYGQVNMKTDDAFFRGFPSYWNGIALYLYWLKPQPLVAVLLVVIPAVLSFIPTRYLYPSKNPIFSKTNWGLALVWAVLVIYLLLQEEPNQTLVLLSLSYPIFYMVSSFYVDWCIRHGKRFAA